MSELRSTVGQPVGVAELLGVRKKTYIFGTEKFQSIMCNVKRNNWLFFVQEPNGCECQISVENLASSGS